MDTATIFAQSHERMMARSGTKFLTDFYKMLFGSSPEIAQKFEKTDLKIQKGVLKASFFHILHYYHKGEVSDSLREIAKSHNVTGYNVRPEMYDLWLDALISSVSQNDPEADARVLSAWREVFGRGIDFLKANYSA